MNAPLSNAELDVDILRRERMGRFRLIPFDDLKPSPHPAYLIKGLLPRVGLCVVWGPPKCGKSFWTMDALLHVALGWSYRTRKVVQGPVVYCAFEGQDGYGKRADAFRQRHLAERSDATPFYLVASRMSLIKDHPELIRSIEAQLDGAQPVAIALDTLNRSFEGSESDDKDMGLYVKAGDALREKFDCAVVIVHHCGIEGSRPRGHTSLTGAVDAQLAVKRDGAGNIVVTVEWLKDGAEGDTIASRLEPLTVGVDEEGDEITSCVIEPVEAPAPVSRGPKLTANQQSMFSILHRAGQGGLTVDDWNEAAREAGLGVKRKADLFDFREALRSKRLVYEHGGKWFIQAA